MIWSIVSEETTKDQRLTELKIYLSAEIYPEKLNIDSAIEEATKIPQNILKLTRIKFFCYKLQSQTCLNIPRSYSYWVGSTISITNSLLWLTP